MTGQVAVSCLLVILLCRDMQPKQAVLCLIDFADVVTTLMRNAYLEKHATQATFGTCLRHRCYSPYAPHLTDYRTLCGFQRAVLTV